MSVLTIVEAAKQFNLTRPRIYRAIKKGELTPVLSDEGIQLVQVQDMIRVFGNKKPKAVQKPVRNTVFDTDRKLVELLEEQLKKAEEDKVFLKQQILDLRQDFDEYKLRIEHQEQLESKTHVSVTDHVQPSKSLQVEHAVNRLNEHPNLKKSADSDKPSKKSLLRRLVSEIFR